MLTPKVTIGKKLSQCRECMFKQKRFQFMLENVSPLTVTAWGKLFQALGPARENGVRQTFNVYFPSAFKETCHKLHHVSGHC